MVTNQNLSLRIRPLRIILIVTIFLFLLFLSYNYLIKPVDFDIIFNEENKSNDEIEWQVIQKNKLNTVVPIQINKIKTEIIEGSELIEIIPIDSKTLRIKAHNYDGERKILIQFSIPEINIKKVFEFYITSQKV